MDKEGLESLKFVLVFNNVAAAQVIYRWFDKEFRMMPGFFG